MLEREARATTNAARRSWSPSLRASGSPVCCPWRKPTLMNTLGTSLRTLQYGPLTLPSRYVLAPLAGYTNLPFRTAIRELGGLGLATTDLVNARALLTRSRRAMELIETCPEDRPVA